VSDARKFELVTESFDLLKSAELHGQFQYDDMIIGYPMPPHVRSGERNIENTGGLKVMTSTEIGGIAYQFASDMAANADKPLPEKLSTGVNDSKNWIYYHLPMVEQSQGQTMDMQQLTRTCHIIRASWMLNFAEYKETDKFKREVDEIGQVIKQSIQTYFPR